MDLSHDGITDIMTFKFLRLLKCVPRREMTQHLERRGVEGEIYCVNFDVTHKVRNFVAEILVFLHKYF